MEKLRVGFALCGSYCTFERVLNVVEDMAAGEEFELFPIMSETAAATDTRFGKAADHIARLEHACGRPVITSIREAEPIGPKKLFDVLVVAPCTGNTLGKLAGGITDSAVTMAVKAHLRNDRPVVLAVSTNDALAGSAANIGALLARRNYYFVPMTQDDPAGKPRSMVAKMEKIPDTIRAAMIGLQLQPIVQ
ncbi:MAG: dipicolinate synthase subunit B [Ruminococcaceae bacterium]|nr:dipicolinate synthase subunit B [Oscillospiraceae bacterium]